MINVIIVYITFYLLILTPSVGSGALWNKLTSFPGRVS